MSSYATLHAQDPEHGFLNVANIVPSDKKCKITIMGKDLVPGGLNGVESTGWFIVPAGEHPMSLEIEGYKPASGVITVTANMSSLYVIFLQQIGEKKDKEGKEIPPSVRIKKCEPFEQTKGFFLKAMSLCPDDERFDIGPHALRVNLFGTQEITGWNGGAFKVTHEKNEIGGCAGSQEKGSYYLLLGTDHHGKYCSLLVRNEKQELPPWMQKKEK
jgi:hypothetical protein